MPSTRVAASPSSPARSMRSPATTARATDEITAHISAIHTAAGGVAEAIEKMADAIGQVDEAAGAINEQMDAEIPESREVTARMDEAARGVAASKPSSPRSAPHDGIAIERARPDRPRALGRVQCSRSSSPVLFRPGAAGVGGSRTGVSMTMPGARHSIALRHRRADHTRRWAGTGRVGAEPGSSFSGVTIRRSSSSCAADDVHGDVLATRP